MRKCSQPCCVHQFTMMMRYACVFQYSELPGWAGSWVTLPLQEPAWHARLLCNNSSLSDGPVPPITERGSHCLTIVYVCDCFSVWLRRAAQGLGIGINITARASLATVVQQPRPAPAPFTRHMFPQRQRVFRCPFPCEWICMWSKCLERSTGTPWDCRNVCL
jgi:hypothetical protein